MFNVIIDKKNLVGGGGGKLDSLILKKPKLKGKIFSIDLKRKNNW
jgi:hypothetical protein